MGVRLEDRYDVAAADDLIGLLRCHIGEPEKALQLHRSAASVFSELNSPKDESLARSFAAWALLEMDRPAEALVEARAAERLDPGSGLGATAAIALADLGRLDEALRQVPVLPAPAEGPFAWFARVRAHVATRAGREEEARELFSQALKVLEINGDRAEHRCCLRQIARLGITSDGPAGSPPLF